MSTETAARQRYIFRDLSGADAAAVLGELAAAAAGAGLVADGAVLAAALREREALGSTATGGGIAIPHCRLPGFAPPFIALGVSRQPIPFGAADGQPVRFFFLVVARELPRGAHLLALRAIARWLSAGGDPALLAEAADDGETPAPLGEVGA